MNKIACHKSNFLHFLIILHFAYKKNVDDEFQKRIVIDIKKLNVFTISNVYSLSLQTNIISTMRDCFYISIVDV